MGERVKPTLSGQMHRNSAPAKTTDPRGLRKRCDILADRVETPLFGDDEVLKEFSRVGDLVCQKFIDGVMLYNAPGLSK